MAYTVAFDNTYPPGNTAANLISATFRNKTTMVGERLVDLFGMPNYTDDPLKPRRVQLGYAALGYGGYVGFNDDAGTYRWFTGIGTISGARNFVVQDQVAGVARLTVDAVTGNVTVSNALQIGVAPFASSAHIRLPNAASVGWRNNANTADVAAISVNASDQLVLGTGSNYIRAAQHLIFDTDNTLDIGLSSTNRPRTIYAATSIESSLDVNAKRYLVAGTNISGQGGQFRSISDDGVTRWAIGVSGTAGSKDFIVYDLATPRQPITVSYSSGLVSLSSGLNVTGSTTVGALNLNAVLTAQCAPGNETTSWLNTSNTSDTNTRFFIDYNGRLGWGPGNTTQDVFLQRYSTGSIFVSGAIGASLSTIAYTGFFISTSGDSNSRWYVQGDGETWWGPGTATADVRLHRYAAGRLNVGGVLSSTDQLIAAFGTGAGIICYGPLAFGQDQTEYLIKPPTYGGAIRIRGDSVSNTDRGLQLGYVNGAGTYSGFWDLPADTGHFYPLADNTRNIGAANTNRIANVYATNLVFTTAYAGFNVNFAASTDIGYVKTAGDWTTDSGVGDLVIRCASAKLLRFNTDGGTGGSAAYINSSNFTFNRNIIFGTDNTNDIGASGANRPRNIYAAGAIYSGSSRDLKTDIKSTNLDALSIINSINVVEYKYKMFPEAKKIGFVAEETNDLLTGPEHNNIDITNAIGLLLLAVQQLSNKIDAH